ncbi:tetratricopeptide repeat protein [Xanthobacter autotrophicus]|uniref:tetratricopeptide repeat protein n=1 Tax=Xanthobacter TaxID=279 RepID=UPI0024AC3E4F|nr:tetratricopeptide repeat protein [Xanthobacter autotrophicus]MDI4664732.1 tetratricopeptide repeat protein [Xanthobacter autotrophicus]
MAEDERAAFSRATALHREGRLDEAIEIYRRLLKARPGVFEVERLIVFAELQAGRTKEAHAVARRAKQGHSGNPHAHVLLGATLQAERKWDRALAAFEAAAKLDPGLVEAHYMAGNVLASLGRDAEAVARFDKVLALDPRFLEAIANRAQVRVRLGQEAEALADFERLSELQPWEPAHFLAKGALLLGFGRGAEAARAAQAALHLKPDLADAHFLIGQTFNAAGDLPAARLAFSAALAAAPDRSAFRLALAQVEHQLAEREGAEDAPCPVEPEAPGSGSPADAAPDRGDAGQAPVDFDVALAVTEEAVAAVPVAPSPLPLDPAPPDGGIVPEHPAAVEVPGPYAPDYLAAGRWAEGWAALEAERVLAASAQQPLPLPRWDGVEAPSTLIVTAEGDLADLILFGRLLRVLADRKIPARLLAEAEHVAVLSRIDARVPVAGDLAGVDVRDPHLRWVPLVGLPGLVAPDPHDWPHPPYLLADPARIARWRDLRPQGFAVGIGWNGDTGLLAAFAELAALDGVALLSLETGPAAEAELAASAFGGQVARLVPDWDKDGALTDTAAVIQHLDLVVTGEGALAHLAGARGRPGVVAVDAAAHWCWGREAGASPLYPSLGLVRGRRGHWSDVASHLAAAVAVRRDAGR